MNAMITSRINYCNALLYDTSGKNLVTLQRLQNVAAKIIVGGSRYEHVTLATCGVSHSFQDHGVSAQGGK